MKRRQLFQALGGALLLPYEPKTIYSFPAPQAQVLEVSLGFFGAPPINPLSDDGLAMYRKLMEMPPRASSCAAVYARLVAHVQETLREMMKQAIVPPHSLALVSMGVQFDGPDEAHARDQRDQGHPGHRPGGGTPAGDLGGDSNHFSEAGLPLVPVS
jgi:hypothetical protein